jgi:hypothetical protein
MLTFQVMAAAQAEVGKLISKVEIPAFIPRQDLMDQLLRWAHMTIQEGGVAAVGCPTKVSVDCGLASFRSKFEQPLRMWGSH